MSRTVTSQQLEVFDQFDRVLAFLREHPELDSPSVRGVLARSTAGFLRSRVERLNVIPDVDRPEFDRRARDLGARWAR